MATLYRIDGYVNRRIGSFEDREDAIDYMVNAASAGRYFVRDDGCNTDTYNAKTLEWEEGDNSAPRYR